MITLSLVPEPHIPAKCLSRFLSVDEWLWRKFEKLYLNVQEGYPCRTSETAGLNRDQFVKPPKTLKWYGMHCEQKVLLRYNSLPCWTDCCSRMAAGPANV